MKRAKILIFVLLLALLATPVVASSIENALWYGLITISNNGTANTSIATTANISTENLIAGNYLNANANNTVMRNSSGADVAFQPGYTDANPWCMWVPSIGANSYLTYILYTNNSTGGKIRYFPDDDGMETVDSATLELGDNFTIEQSGWVDTSLAASSNQTPIGFNDPDAKWLEEPLAYDGDIATDADTIVQAGVWGSYLELLTPMIPLSGVYYNVKSHADVTLIDIDIYNSACGAWVDVYQGAVDQNTWTLKGISSANVTKARIRFYNNGGVARGVNINEFQFLTLIRTLIGKGSDFWTYISGTGNITSWISSANISVTATGISSDDMEVKTTANVTTLGIYVDDVLKDSTPLTANVTDNSANYTYYENSCAYWEYTKITIDGTLQQHIEWEYDSIFEDLSGNGHNATPTFRGASCDADVSANLTAFLPVAEAKAPDFALATAPPFIDDLGPNITGNFTTTPPTPPGGFPLAGVIIAIANATSTPAQLPLLIVAGFITLAASLAMSAVLRKSGSGSIVVKIITITAFLGIFIALKNFGVDFWMLVVFLVISTAVAIGSRHFGWN